LAGELNTKLDDAFVMYEKSDKMIVPLQKEIQDIFDSIK